MKLIIDISEEAYKLRVCNPVWFDSNMDKAIRNGTPFLKYHGDLIDRDKLLNTLEKLEWIRTNCSVDEDNTNILEDIINEEPTIIEANY